MLGNDQEEGKERKRLRDSESRRQSETYIDRGNPEAQVRDRKEGEQTKHRDWGATGRERRWTGDEI